MTLEELLTPYPGPIVALVERLRRLVKAALPDAEERVYPVWKGIGYVHPRAGYVCALFPQRDHVALAFERGVHLSDPEGLLRPGRTRGKQVRYVEVARSADVRVKALRDLLAQAVALRAGGAPARSRPRPKPDGRRAAPARGGEGRGRG